MDYNVDGTADSRPITSYNTFYVYQNWFGHDPLAIFNGAWPPERNNKELILPQLHRHNQANVIRQ